MNRLWILCLALIGWIQVAKTAIIPGTYYDVKVYPDRDDTQIFVWNYTEYKDEDGELLEVRKTRGGIHEFKGDILASKARFIFFISGYGGGKTITGPVWLLQEIERYPGESWVVLGLDYPNLNRQAIPYFLDLINQTAHRGYYDEQDHIYYMNPAAGGGKVHFVTARTPGEVHRIQSVHARGAWINEAGFICWEAWNALRSRVNLRGGRIFIETTARATSWWIKDDGYDVGEVHRLVVKRDEKGKIASWHWKKVKEADPGERTAVFQSESKDNPTFDEEALETERKRLSAEEFDTYYGGGIPTVRGLIYPNFHTRVHVVTDEKEEKRILERINSAESTEWRWCIALDKGFFPHPTAILWMIHDPIRDEVIVYDAVSVTEKISDQIHKAITVTNKNYTHITTQVHCGGDNPQITAEYNEAARRAKDEYVYINLDKGLMDVERGIARVRRLFGLGKLKILGNRCPELVEELKHYRKEMKESVFSKEWAVVKKRDDYADALRYGIAAMGIFMEDDVEELKEQEELAKRQKQAKVISTTPPVVPEPAGGPPVKPALPKIPGVSTPVVRPANIIPLPGFVRNR